MLGRTNFIAAMAVLGAGFVAASLFAPHNGRLVADQPTKRTASKIGLVNIADVLKQSDSANKRGAEISARRKQYFDRVTELRTEMNALSTKTVETTDNAEKVAMQKRATRIQRQIEDLDRDAQTKLSEVSNTVIVEVYTEIRDIITEIAVRNDLDLVLIYPASKEMSPVLATLMLQTPAAMPIYNRPELDLTAEVVLRINQKYPADKPTGAKPEVLKKGN